MDPKTISGHMLRSKWSKLDIISVCAALTRVFEIAEKKNLPLHLANGLSSERRIYMGETDMMSRINADDVNIFVGTLFRMLDITNKDLDEAVPHVTSKSTWPFAQRLFAVGERLKVGETIPDAMFVEDEDQSDLS
jgi:methionyl-tRNA synthetase